MGFYLKLGRKRALWLEWRQEWHNQKAAIERLRHDWIICLPLVQLVYTPAIA